MVYNPDKVEKEASGPAITIPRGLTREQELEFMNSFYQKNSLPKASPTKESDPKLDCQAPK